jgi:hypothetical protein
LEFGCRCWIGSCLEAIAKFAREIDVVESIFTGRFPSSDLRSHLSDSPDPVDVDAKHSLWFVAKPPPPFLDRCRGDIGPHRQVSSKILDPARFGGDVEAGSIRLVTLALDAALGSGPAAHPAIDVIERERHPSTILLCW